jgi:hypothetical protein
MATAVDGTGHDEPAAGGAPLSGRAWLAALPVAHSSTCCGIPLGPPATSGGSSPSSPTAYW